MHVHMNKCCHVNADDDDDDDQVEEEEIRLNTDCNALKRQPNDEECI